MVDSPILFLVFNRPIETQQVFDKIRSVKPKRLYVSSDGPRNLRNDDLENCAKVKDIVSKIDWECNVFYNFSDINLGCKSAISSAIDWFFSNEEQGIILEDDCLPTDFFFKYCDSLLELFKNDENISCINGNNFIQEKMVENEFYLSRYNHCWGWATWRRAWVDYDKDLSFWPEWKFSENWKCFFTDSNERRYWRKIFDNVYDSKIDSWAYAWSASIWYKNRLSIMPPINLVKNIGFGENATHTSGSTFDRYQSIDGEFSLDLNTNLVSDNLDNYLFYKVFFVSFKNKIQYKLNKFQKF